MDKKPRRRHRSFETELRSFVKNKMRYASLRWPARNEAKKRARKSRGQYECRMCLKEFKENEIILDHINPVVPVDSNEFNFDNWIRSLLPPPEGFQCLCLQCNDIKTKLEDDMRSYYIAKRKEENEEK